MDTIQNMPEQIISHVQQHDWLRSKGLVSEPAANLQSALVQVANLVVNAFAELAGTASGRELLWNMARESSDADIANSTIVASQRGAELVKSAFDDRYHGTINTVATDANVQTATVIRLIEMAATAALEVTVALVTGRNWNAHELGKWLRSQHIAAAVAKPVMAEYTASKVLADASEGTGARTAAWFSRHTGALLVTAGFLAAAELGYILGTHSRSDDVELSQVSNNNTANESATTGSGAFGAMPVANLSSTAPVSTSRGPAAVPVVLRLKNGLRQVIGANSTESKLYQFLIDPAKEIDLVDPTKGWIGFDRIYFESNKATLTNESLWQLSNVASILKRFPASKIKLGGYTDSTGAPLRNLQLSQARAKAAQDALVSLGVSANRLTAVGYGALDNIASNTTEEGRTINRRVSLQVTEK